MSGLREEQIDELEHRVAKFLEKPWKKSSGRLRGLTLRNAIIVTCSYLRQNIIEEVWGEIFGVSQPTISRCITTLTPLAEKATVRDRPTMTAVARALKARSHW